MSDRNGYNGEIDVWKFVFAVVIFLFHGVKYTMPVFPKGSICVEFFFLVTGYLMAAGVARHPDDSVADVLRRKLAVVFCPFVVSFFICFVTVQIVTDGFSDLFDVYKKLLLSAREFMLLRTFGIEGGSDYNAPGWYISSMMLGLVAVYPLFRRFRDGFALVAAPVIAMVCYGVLFNDFNKLTVFRQWWFITTAGTLRAVAGICLGTFIHALVSRRGTACRKGCGLAVDLILEVAAAYAIFHFMSGFLDDEYSEQQSFAILLMFVLLVYIVFSGRTGIAKLLPRSVASFLGRLSLYLYLNHYVMVYILKRLSEDCDETRLAWVYIGGTTAAMALCRTLTWLCQWIRSVAAGNGNRG